MQFVHRHRTPLFNLDDFFLPLEATKSKLTVRGGDTTSDETKKLSVQEDLDSTKDTLPDISDEETEDNTQGILFDKVN